MYNLFVKLLIYMICYVFHKKCSPGGAVRERQFGSNMGDVDDGAGGCVLRSINDKLESDFDFVGNVLAADLILTETKGTALSCGGRAASPADGANTIGFMFALRVAKSSTLYLILVANERSASCAAVGVLGARDSNICHTLRAVWGADAAADIMEVIVAFRVPKSAPFLASIALVHLSSTSAIGIRLVAVGSIIAEARVVGAVLPADGTDSRESGLAEGVAESAILILVLGAGRERLTSSAAIGFLPAGVRNIGVMVVVMVVVDGGSIIVFLSVSQRLLRVVGEVRHMLFVFVV